MGKKKGGAKKTGSKGKKEKVKKAGKKMSALYEISGSSIKRKNLSCPKCGPGKFLGKHKDRVVCGKCQYVEYFGKSSAGKEEVKEDSKEEKKEE